MTRPFILDPRIAATSIFLADLALCQARLQDDARFAWLVLIPRESDLSELEHLRPGALPRLMAEVVAAGAAARAVGAALARPVERLNLGQLGLVVAQLHLHVVGRRADDVAWPGPVWGSGASVRYGDADRANAVATARGALADAGVVDASAR